MFGLGNKCFDVYRSDLSDKLIEDEMFILSVKGRSEASLADLCNKAQQVWKELYGNPRKAQCARRKSTKRLGSSTSGSLTSWYKYRKRAVSDAVANSSNADVMVGAEGWTEQMDKEVAFQTAKRRRRALEALEQMVLNPGEIQEEFQTDDPTALLQEKNLHETKSRRNYFTDKKRQQRALVTPSCPIFYQKPIYVASGIDMSRISAFVAEQKMQVVADRDAADIFVVPDILAPGQRICWQLVLAGGFLISEQYMREQNGPFLTISGNLNLRRTVYVSPAFLEAHQELANIMLACMEKCPNHQWKLLYSLERYVAILNARHGQKRGSECLAFVTTREQADVLHAVGGRGAVLPTAVALVRLLNMDRWKSQTGMCRR